MFNATTMHAKLVGLGNALLVPALSLGCLVCFVSRSSAEVAQANSGVFANSSNDHISSPLNVGSPWACEISPETKAKLTIDDPTYAAYSGWSVAISGKSAVVGAYGKDDFGSDSGAAYIFSEIGGNWQQVAKLLADDAAEDDRFGFSVAIDGDTSVVGAYGDDDEGDFTGAAYIYREIDGVWQQIVKLVAADAAAGDYFGIAVSIDADTVLVGASLDDDDAVSSGSVYVFRELAGTWQQIAKFNADDAGFTDFFGSSVALEGDTAIVGARNDDHVEDSAGSAYIFREIGGTWQQLAKLTAADASEEDWFGKSVSISGDTVVVGAYGHNAGGTDSGAAYVFREIGGVWQYVEQLTAPDANAFDYFGYSVAISGDTIVVGADSDDDGGTYSGSAYVFREINGEWQQISKLTAFDVQEYDRFGYSVAIAGNNPVIGARGKDVDGVGRVGASYVFELTRFDCNSNGMPDECDISYGSSDDCNLNGIPDLCDIAGDTSQDCDFDGIPEECDPTGICPSVCDSEVFFEDFNSYLESQHPIGWVDAVVERSDEGDDTALAVRYVDSDAALATGSSETDRISQFIASTMTQQDSLTYTGRMRLTDPNGRVGVTILHGIFESAAAAPQYIRFAVEPQHDAERTFQLSATNANRISGEMDTGVQARVDTWYRFRIEVDVVKGAVDIEAKVWQEDEAEPSESQAHASVLPESFPIRNTVGVWSAGPGSKYWDDIRVASRESGIPCNDYNACTTDDQCVKGECVGTPVDCSALDGECELGVCNTVGGLCETIPANEQGICDDQNLCTYDDVCLAGTCVGTPVDCTALDDMCVSGACDSMTGICEEVASNEGGSCDDGDGCTPNDVCVSGICEPSIGNCSGSEIPTECQRIVFVNQDVIGGLNDGTSWSDAYISLQDALTEASVDCSVTEIWVAQGVYLPDHGVGWSLGDRGASFLLRDNLGLYGGFSGSEATREERDWELNETILSGDLLQDDVPVACVESSPDCDDFGGVCMEGTCILPDQREDNSATVVLGNGTDTTAIINGFTIADGVGPSGGGMSNMQSSPTIANCLFTRNSGLASGPFARPAGGMYNLQSNPVISNCEFLGNASDRDGGGMLNVQSSPVIIGSTFTANKAGLNGGGVYNDASSAPTVLNCMFSNNSTSQGGGGMYNTGTPPVLTGCKFLGNTAYAGGGMVNYGSSPQTTNCVFSGNKAVFGGGVHSASSSFPPFVNCTFVGNQATQSGGGIYNSNDSFSGIANSILWGNTPSPVNIFNISYRYSIIEGYPGGVNNGVINSDPRFVDSDGADDISGTEDDDLRLVRGSPAIDAGDNGEVPAGIVVDIDGLPRLVDDPSTMDVGVGTPPLVDLGAFEFQGHVRFVNHAASFGANDGSDWDHAYLHLQDALVEASTNSFINEIWVAAGTYTPDKGGNESANDREATFRIQDNLAIFGGFSGVENSRDERNPVVNLTVLSGDLLGDDGADFANNGDNCYHVLTSVGVGASAILSDLVITGGNANGAHGDQDGGGMYNSNASPTVDNCVFTANRAERFGGSMYNSNGAPSIVNCTFDNSLSQRGGGMCNDDSNPSIVRCLFQANVAYTGGGIYCLASEPIIANSRFIENEAVASGGGMSSEADSFPEVIQCIFSGNRANRGGAINSQHGDMRIANSTVVGNFALAGGGALRFESDDRPAAVNTILWGNAQSEIEVVACSPVFARCVIEGGSGGFDGNVRDADPRFADAAGADSIIGTEDDDYHLLPGSPAIDFGDNHGLPTEYNSDFDGNPRYANDPTTSDVGVGNPPNVDCGVFEFVLGDCDRNGVADMLDHSVLDGCLSNPGDTVPNECSCLDFNLDSDVDLQDFSVFQIGFGL